MSPSHTIVGLRVFSALNHNADRLLFLAVTVAENKEDGSPQLDNLTVHVGFSDVQVAAIAMGLAIQVTPEELKKIEPLWQMAKAKVPMQAQRQDELDERLVYNS